MKLPAAILVRFGVGGRRALFWDQYYEILIYEGALSDPERAAVESYLNQEWAILTISASASSIGEAGGSVELQVIRPGTSGNLDVQLNFTGSATFGSDYAVDGLAGSGIVTIPDGNDRAILSLQPIPDSRTESHETVTVTVLGVSQTITIINDDSNQVPLDGWSLIELGQFYGTATYGYGINIEGRAWVTRAAITATARSTPPSNRTAAACRCCIGTPVGTLFPPSGLRRWPSTMLARLLANPATIRTTVPARTAAITSVLLSGGLTKRMPLNLPSSIFGSTRSTTPRLTSTNASAARAA
jgi:hypothetical protein